MSSRTPTEIWYANPNEYIRQCAELNVLNIAWDRGYLVKHRIDPRKLIELNYPITSEYRMLLIGEQGTAEINRNEGEDLPAAVYPTWDYTTSNISILESLMESNVAESPAARDDPNVSPELRPVIHQEHRVVVIRPPDSRTGLGMAFYRALREMQRDYPDCIVHLHGINSFRTMFGTEVASVDFHPRVSAQKGSVVLPNGRVVSYSEAAKTPQWVNVIGFSLGDLKEANQRCLFNIKSSLWAAEYYLENINFRSRGAAGNSPVKSTTGSSMSSALKVLPGDKVACDTCSLINNCKYFRVGDVCSMPSSDGAKLAALFKTRDAGSIIEGLGEVMAHSTERLEMGLRVEEEFGELSPEVTKILSGLFSNGVKLAKLVDPTLRTAGVNVNVLNASGQRVELTQQQQVAASMSALESAGHHRKDITDVMLAAHMLRGEIAPIPIEVTSVQSDPV